MAERTFEKAQPMVRCLREMGYELGKNTIYRHLKPGKLEPGKDGLYHEDDILKYAHKHFRKAEDKTTPEKAKEERSLADVTLRAKEASARINELKLQKAQGQLMERELVELEFAKRTAVFKKSFLAFAREVTAGVIAQAEGNPAAAAKVQAYLERQARISMDRLARAPEVLIPAHEMPGESNA